MRGTQETKWEAERRVERLTEMWAEGKSASTIASILGLTRNAVIGKAHRLGLPRREAGNFQFKKVLSKYAEVQGDDLSPDSHPYPIYYGTIAKSGSMCNSTKRTSPGLRDTTVTSCDPPPGEQVSFENLEPHHCRWPFGDKEVTYCGRKKETGVSYCAAHLDRSKYGL